jgi:hypothetical protein
LTRFVQRQRAAGQGLVGLKLSSELAGQMGEASGVFIELWYLVGLLAKHDLVVNQVENRRRVS